MTKSTPLMSIIVIVKNNQDLLPRAIDSVLSQTQQDLELIIVNDGSTDNTGNIIDKYRQQDSRIRALHQDVNIGRASARNIGLDASLGKYITFLDADDYLPETTVAVLTETAEKHQADIVFGRIQPFDSITNKLIPHHYTDAFMDKELHGIRLRDHPVLLGNHSIVGRGYRRNCLNENNVRFSTIRRNAEDVTFSFYSQFYAQRMSIVPDKILYHYSAGNFMDTANRSKVEDARDSILETLEFAIEHCQESTVKKLHQKAVIFSCHLGRAKKVFGVSQELRDYIPTLLPLVKNAPEDIIDNLPPYYQRFARAIRSFDFDRALYLFENISMLGSQIIGKIKPPKLEAEKSEEQILLNSLHRYNQLLGAELETMYNSHSWRLTYPLRLAGQLYRRCKRKSI